MRSKPLALLVFPPVYDFALYDLFLKPYGLLRLAHWLDRCGYRVKLINALSTQDQLSIDRLGQPKRKRGRGKFFRSVIDSPEVFGGVQRSFARYGIVSESLQAQLCAEQPDVVLVSSGMTYWYPGVVESIRLIRRIHPRVPVILGGIYASLCPEHALRHDADRVISGEALPELARALEGLGLPDLTGSGGLLEQVLLLPEAGWQGGVIRLNRGCPLQCRYCASPSLHHGFTTGDPELSFRTVNSIHRRFGTQEFAFYDDALLYKKEDALIPFLEHILESELELSFFLPNAVHLSYLDANTARLMFRAGFREIRLGVESMNAEFHTDLDKKLEPAMMAAGIELLRQAGFQAGQIIVYILAGLPGQTAEEVEESIRSVTEQGILVSLAEYSPVPQSALWEKSVRLSRFPLAEEPLTHNNSIVPLQWNRFTPADLERLKSLAHTLSLNCMSEID